MSDYTRERWEQIKATTVRPRMFHNYVTLRYPMKIASPFGGFITEKPNLRPHETSIPRVRT